MINRTTPIIIETPTRERLVLVPLLAVSRTEGGDELLTIRTANARDATPADLLLAGYRECMVAADAERWARAASDWQAKAESLLARAEKAEAARNKARRDALDAHVTLTLRAEKAERELATARYEHDATLEARDMIHAKLTTAERERDDLLEGDMREARTQRERADTAEAERDTLRAELARLGVAHERAREGSCRDSLEDHKAADARTRALLAPLLGLELTEESAEVMVSRFVARQQSTKDRATEEELFAIADAVYEEAHGGDIPNGPHEIALRVAAHVRKERCDGAGLRRLGGKPGESVEAFVTRLLSGGGFVQWGDGKREVGCLVAQAVGMGAHVQFYPYADIGSARADDSWITGVRGVYKRVPPADVPATLARLLGEVSRG